MCRSVMLFQIGVLALALVSGCGPADGPPTIHYGKDICSECGMMISEILPSAGLAVESWRAEKFDDIGCLSKYLRKKEVIGKTWVRDYPSGRWIPAQRAWFAENPGVITPMGSGILAYFEKSEAEKMTGPAGGFVMNFTELLEPNNREGSQNES